MIQFDPSIAASGGYDYLVDFLRGTARQAKEEHLAPERIGKMDELAKELERRIEQAVDRSEDGETAAADAEGAHPLEEMLRELSSRTDS